jgi:hypothetical protein
LSSSWWAAKVRRFARYFFARVHGSERRELMTWLTAPQLALFDGMHPADQRHGLDVVRALRAAGHHDGDLLLAGLLHDCGKGRAIHVWHRVAWSLGDHYGRRVRAVALRLPTFRSAFATLDAHAERSAQLAIAAGCSPRSAELIRHQAEPVDAELGRALQLADQAN